MTAAIEDKSDKELAADARMLVAELSKVVQVLTKRRIEVDITTFTDGTVGVDVYRQNRESL